MYHIGIHTISIVQIVSIQGQPRPKQENMDKLKWLVVSDQSSVSCRYWPSPQQAGPAPHLEHAELALLLALPPEQALAERSASCQWDSPTPSSSIMTRWLCWCSINLRSRKNKYFWNNFWATQLQRSTCPKWPSPRCPSWNSSCHTAWRGDSLHHKIRPEAHWTHQPAARLQTWTERCMKLSSNLTKFSNVTEMQNCILPFHFLLPPLFGLIYVLIESHWRPSRNFFKCWLEALKEKVLPASAYPIQ